MSLVAKSIAEHLLQVTGNCLENGDFDGFADCFKLPKTLVTFEGQRVIRTREEFREVFDAVRANLVTQDAVRLERYVEEASFVQPDLIASTHISQVHLRSGDTLPAYPTLSTLSLVEDKWLIGDSQYAVDGPMAHALASSPWDSTEAQGSELSQRFITTLERLTQAFLRNDFELLKDCVQLPALFHSRRGAQMITTEDELRADLALYQAEFAMLKVDDILRVPRAVHALGQNRLVGVYTTHILSGTDRVVPSFDSSMYLERGDDDKWRASCVMHAMGHITLGEQAPGRNAANAPFTVIMKSGPQEAEHKTIGDRHV
ncbi:hypothetical protein ACS3SW_18545 [Roseobacteraceae bacterium S113]